MAWACKKSGIVVLILLQKEDNRTPGWEQGEPEGPKEGGYKRSVWVIGVSAFLRGRAGRQPGPLAQTPGSCLHSTRHSSQEHFLNCF